jgi:hypothetical protein
MEKHLEQCREWRINNPERAREVARNARTKERSKSLARIARRKWIAKNPDKAKEYSASQRDNRKLWAIADRLKNPDRHKKYNKKRYQKKMEVERLGSYASRELILARRTVRLFYRAFVCPAQPENVEELKKHLKEVQDEIARDF